jgi:ADP-heptose:LPS heptosyltransferase
MKLTIKHAGNIGDIIYSLPAMNKAAQIHNKKVTVLLQTNVRAQYADHPNFNHPSGSVQLNEKGAEMLKPLLLSLPFVESVEIADSFKSCTYNFDRMRDIGLRYLGSISRWYFYAFPQLTCDLSTPLRFEVDPIKTTRIVMNRSARYHNPTFDYRVLLPYQHMITFIGLEEEYEVIKRKLPEMKYQPVNDFAEMAGIIKGCELFIGNQSMAYSIAEISGKTRILEVCPNAHNCIPMTPNGYDCINLQNLIDITKEMFVSKPKRLEKASIASDEQ